MLMVPSFGTLGPGLDLSNLSLAQHDNHSNLSAEQSLLAGGQFDSLSFTMDSQAVIDRPSLGELGLEGHLEVEDDEGLGFEFDANGELFERPVIDEGHRHQLRPLQEKGHIEETFHSNTAQLSLDSPTKRMRISPSVHSTFDVGLSKVGLFHGQEELSPIRPIEQPFCPLHDEVELDMDFSEEKPIITQAVAKSRKRKAHVLTLDNAIELTSIALKDWQSSYLESMKKHKSMRISKQDKNILDENAKLYTWAYQGRVKHPLLQEVFCRRLAGVSAQKRDPPTHEIDLLADLDVTQLEPEVALGDNILNSEVELGLRAGTEEREFLSGQNSLLPWNMSREGSQARSVSGTGLSTNSLLNTPRQFSFLQTPILRSRQASVRPGSRASGAIGMGGLERVDSQEGKQSRAQIESHS
ncbi:Meiotic cohesin complex subunit rec85 / FY16936)) [Taphrina deformans PYCC 5710]|uniref:Meiotic cohesin complex subunit rec85 / FY16936 n=1 Tax=Taphrina deformans (strain PYCC 5710 / ATCC 11124 / CBS 356.35 / IMI 108563 / JCM 9778 / NBRC 8474) TaxID=1097556 RepID=R4XA33_TAPDE|nr:Meiotic cohesin complex subunit rec85 / FY16936)) [Taphrina deformans PYCC 5710]|eukprot:CCG81129.1 Meiotic cohesin complex subunit rec85 / FY16936)) [Taphrina deformans PYCC 5710]